MNAIIVVGSIFYCIEEGWGIIDSIYFCVVTIATVGYGDFSPTNALSKMFTITLAISGIGVLWALLQNLHKLLLKEELKRQINLNSRSTTLKNKKSRL